MSRIDRCWTNAPTPLLGARQFAAWARGKCLAIVWRRHAAPHWVAEHPSHPEMSAAESLEVELELVEDPCRLSCVAYRR